MPDKPLPLLDSGMGFLIEATVDEAVAAAGLSDADWELVIEGLEYAAEQERRDDPAWTQNLARIAAELSRALSERTAGLAKGTAYTVMSPNGWTGPSYIAPDAEAAAAMAQLAGYGIVDIQGDLLVVEDEPPVELDADEPDAS